MKTDLILIQVRGDSGLRVKRRKFTGLRSQVKTVIFTCLLVGRMLLPEFRARDFERTLYLLRECHCTAEGLS